MGGQENARRPATGAPRVEVTEGTPRPLALLSEYARRYPRARKVAESLREGRVTGAIPDWPGWCYLPLGAVHAIVQEEGRGDSPGEDRDLDALVMGALIPWRVTKGIYRFDPDVMGSLWNTPLTGNIPTGVLKHLPEWCCYVDLASSFRPGTQPDPWRGTIGFFVFLSWDTGQNRPELWVVLDTEEGLVPFFLNLRASTIEDCWLSTQKETLLSSGIPVEEVESLLSGEEARLAASYVAGRIAPFLNMTLYLCSADPEIVAASGDGRRPGNPVPRKTRKHGEKLFAAKEVREWDVAWRLGAALRRAGEAGEEAASGGSSGSGARKRPHIRRGHWHSFWRGPRAPERADERELTVKWIPPLAINAKAGGEMPAVVRPVG